MIPHLDLHTVILFTVHMIEEEEWFRLAEIIFIIYHEFLYFFLKKSGIKSFLSFEVCSLSSTYSITEFVTALLF